MRIPYAPEGHQICKNLQITNKDQLEQQLHCLINEKELKNISHNRNTLDLWEKMIESVFFS